MTTRERPLRLAVIGAGAMGAELLRVASGHEDYEVVGICDTDEGTLRRVEADHPGVALTRDPSEALALPGLDAVYVATPPATHAGLVVPALEAGIHVLCEKPLAIDLDEGRRMLRAVERSTATAAVNFSLSDRHVTLELERALDEGEVGDVLGVDVRLVFPEWPRAFQSGAGWVAGRDQGGFVREVLSHFAYLTHRLLGPLTPVTTEIAYDARDPRASEVAAGGRFLAGQVPVTVGARSGLAAPETYEWTLWGSSRSYLFRGWTELLASDGGPWEPVDLPGETGSEATRLTRFARAVRGEPHDHLADFATALAVQEVVEAFHR